jgi:hypothetical protein
VTTGDLIEITGYTEKQIRNFCESGILVPEVDAKGPGHFRMFGTMQVLAMNYTSVWGKGRYSRGAIAKIFDFVLDFSEDELLAEFDKGRTHLIMNLKGEMELIRWKGEHGAAFDLRQAYLVTKDALARVAKHVGGIAFDNRGRRRGSGKQNVID